MASEGGWQLLPHVRSLLLGVVCVTAVIMLYWMYSEQGALQRISDVTAPRAADCPHSPASSQPLQVMLHAPQPNITNVIVNEKPKEQPKWDYNWDKRAWAQNNDAQGVGVRTIVLVRHGKYHLDTGQLDDTGRQQANLTGARLKEMGMPFFRIVHSSMDRARQTAEIISAHLPGVPMLADDLLQEGGPVQPSPTISYWSLPDTTYFVEGPRLESAFRKYFHRADKSQTQQTYELLVGHGNIFRFFALRALQLESSAWMRVFIAHASITVAHINPDGTVSMTRFGDSGHFPNTLVTI